MESQSPAEPFAPWPSLAALGKILPSKRFPGLFYYDSGPGKQNRTLILIHGLGDEADTWRHIIPPLTAAGFRVAAPDLPGFGRSPGRGGLSVHRDAVLELAETVRRHGDGNKGENGGGNSVVFIGSSMGAAVAEAAVLKKPDAAQSIILVDGFFPSGSAPPAPLLAMALPFAGPRYYRALRGKSQAAWESLSPYYADTEKLPPEDRGFLRRRVMDRVESPSQERAFFASLRSMIFHSVFCAGLGRIRDWPGKIHLVWGKEDSAVSRRQADYFLSLRPDAELSVIPGAGHLPQQEEPEKTAAAILAFLERS